MNYIMLDSASCVDMLRFSLYWSGKTEDGVEWYEKLYADMSIEFDWKKRDEQDHEPIVRYPLSIRIGTYRDMFKVPVGDSSIIFGFGRNGKGSAEERREGFLEFNPSKTYPSPQLEYVYKRIEATPEVELTLKRWDFATDYPIKRESVSLMKDKRKYTYIKSNGVTEYLGTRNNNGYVKLYDKQKELEKQGVERSDPLTRLEITIEEDGKRREWKAGGKEIPLEEWPRAVLVPSGVPNQAKGLYGLILASWTFGMPLERCMDFVGRNQRAKYRNKIAEEYGQLAHPVAFDRCRRNAFAWEERYGGLGIEEE